MIFKRVPPNHQSGWSRDEKGMYQERLGIKIHQILVQDKTKGFQYDQPVIMEPRGAVTLPFYVDENQIFVALIQQTRPNIDPTDKDRYDELLAAQEYDEIINLLGTTNWEAPRGLPERTESVLQSALREVEEESGIRTTVIQEAFELANAVTNSTFFVQPVTFMAARVNEKVALNSSNQDATESITSVKWFSIQEIMQMITSSEITCGMTIMIVLLLNNHLNN